MTPRSLLAAALLVLAPLSACDRGQITEPARAAGLATQRDASNGGAPGGLGTHPTPTPFPIFTVSISGPNSTTVYQSAQFFANASAGIPPYTYVWSIREYSPKYGWGPWSAPYNSGTTNYTWAGTNSCGVTSYQLEVDATDASQLTTGAFKTVTVSNPC